MKIHELIQGRLAGYRHNTAEDEELALKEVMQELVLYALSASDFFDKAAFQGGTALRILHQLPRFSEDLDFILKAPDSAFNWTKYVVPIESACEKLGINPEIQDKSKTDTAIRRMFIKDDSVGKLLQFSFAHNPKQKITIKLEIDTNPPAPYATDIKYLDFPVDFMVVVQDLSANFAGKIHALLCRSYVKGRDWFDFLWYLRNKISPDYTFLEAALQQYGPWSGQQIKPNKAWLTKSLSEKIRAIDWEAAKSDVRPFLREMDRESLVLWNKKFFLAKAILL